MLVGAKLKAYQLVVFPPSSAMHPPRWVLSRALSPFLTSGVKHSRNPAHAPGTACRVVIHLDDDQG